MNGSKRCKCRDQSGRELGQSCPKLRRRDGSWNPSHGTWYGKHELPGGPDGKRLYLRVGGFRTEGEMTEFYAAAVRLLGIPKAGPRGHDARLEILDLIKTARRTNAALPDYDDLRQRYLKGAALKTGLLGDYLDAWLAGKRDIRNSTVHGYESHIRVHLRPVLGDVPLDELRVSDIDAMFDQIGDRNERIAEGEEAGRPTSAATQQRILATLRAALQDAMREGRIAHNPAKLVRLAPGKKTRGLVWTPERVAAWQARTMEAAGDAGVGLKLWRNARLRPSPVMVWLPGQLGAFLDHAAQHRLYALFHLIAMTGLRRGEACGLEWADVDVKARTLTVRNQIVQIGWKAEEGAPKTAASEARVSYDAATAEVLKAHRKAQVADQLEWGDAWVDSGKVFTRENGEPLHPAMATDQFERLAHAAGLPPIRLHDLRHGAATLGFAAGLDIKVVSAMLRHSSVSITADLYALILPDVAAQASEAVAKLVPRKAAK